VLIPGNGRLTVTSDDTEALGQMESLLRSIFLRSGGRVRGRDFTIYALRNAGADEAANTLNRIFEEARSITSGNVVIVPDQRLNALIVFAGRSDRERLESLIEALDSERSTDSLTAYETRVIPIQHADAQRVSSVLSGIYRAEMSAGGARQSISIPEGVSSDVASVLRQINAAASSPLLTVQAQSTTNSLVVKAPQNLLDEVETLIQKLDEATVTRSKGLTLIPLRRTSSKRILQALGGILD
jgi:type II secretory pathway component GspD/PulD (secretin)